MAPLFEHPEDWETTFNAEYSIKYWIAHGAPPSKLVMGMPMYGQSFSLEKASNNGLNAIAPGPGQAGEFTRAAGFLAFYGEKLFKAFQMIVKVLANSSISFVNAMQKFVIE